MFNNIIVLFISLFFTISAAFSQGQMPLEIGGRQLNFGFIGSNTNLPIYVGMDFAVHQDITIGGEVRPQFWNKGSFIGLLANGDYHFNTLMDIPSNFDFYLGLEFGFGLWLSGNSGERSGFIGGLHLGGRYYWSDKWGVNIELGGGTHYDGKLGLSMKM